MKKPWRLKIFGVVVGPLAFLCACGVIVTDSQLGGCVGYFPYEETCPNSFYSMDGGQCVYTYYTGGPTGGSAPPVCVRDTTPAAAIKCQGDASVPTQDYSPSTALSFLNRLLPHAAPGNPYPANQMQTFFSTPSGSLPFYVRPTVLSLPFQPLFAGSVSYQDSADNCDSTVTVLSAGYSRGSVIPSVPCNLAVGTPIATGQGSLEIALTPDAKFAFVTNYNGSVAVVDTNALTIAATISTPGAKPFGIAISPDGTTAYVASYNAASPALLVIDVATRTLTSTVPLTVIPQNLFLSPDGSLLWITSQLANNVTILDTFTLMPSAAITAISLPTGIAFNPTGTVAYVASATSPGTVQAVNTQSYSITTSYTVGNEPVDLRMSGSTWLTVMNRTSDFVSQINVVSGQVMSEAASLVPNVAHTGLALIQ